MVFENAAALGHFSHFVLGQFQLQQLSEMLH